MFIEQAILTSHFFYHLFAFSMAVVCELCKSGYVNTSHISCAFKFSLNRSSAVGDIQYFDLALQI